MRWTWVVYVGVGVYLGWSLTAEGNLFLGVFAAAVLFIVAWRNSPWSRGRSERHRDVIAMPPADRRVVVYWRPGCQYCARLRRSLGDLASRAHWVNIWQDEEAAAFVRSVNNGNETVPTVVLAGTPVSNPDPAAVREHLESGPEGAREDG